MQPVLEHNYNLFNSPEFIKSEWKYLKQQLKNVSDTFQYPPPYSIDVKTGQRIPIVDPT